ncbi:NERD domain-containing protein [Sedimentibacter saalensis]|uniref:Topoisomerase-like DNA binding C4 zinc finger protein n=1 Tax=Sedimentibacter saalensis TaxID=130788 RepID=A0A562JLK1_9FIRM|nr:NERD domain-containing protein [Sedimentibacter saalensis]TWH83634.1 topoisomerase-like DNA binding C4 zinc finger protein [Sedimentibacter saalensis]
MYYLIAIAIAGFILNLPTVKGFFGEFFIRVILKLLNKKKYIVINDVLIPTNNGKTAQIDHVVVSNYGIFVIETKNYSGWIFGNENSINWTQVIYKTKNQFYNPILQNKGHVKALQDLLVDYPDVKYIPIVVFTLNANFKKLEVTSHVVYSLGLLSIIKMYDTGIISEAALTSIYQRIINANNTDRVARQEHVVNIQEYKYKTETGKCPRCSGNLVERNGKYGAFIGCSNYPKCRYVLKEK